MRKRDTLVKEIRKVEKELIKHPARTRQEIITDIFESKVRTINLEPPKNDDCFVVSHTRLSRLLRERGISEDIVDSIIAGIQEDCDEEAIIDIVIAAIDSPNDLQDLSSYNDGSKSWLDLHSFFEMSKKDWLQWIARMLVTAKLSIESINSIILGLELNLEPAKNVTARILNRLGISAFLIEWIFEKLNAQDDE